MLPVATAIQHGVSEAVIFIAFLRLKAVAHIPCKMQQQLGPSHKIKVDLQKYRNWNHARIISY